MSQCTPGVHGLDTRHEETGRNLDVQSLLSKPGPSPPTQIRALRFLCCPQLGSNNSLHFPPHHATGWCLGPMLMLELATEKYRLPAKRGLPEWSLLSIPKAYYTVPSTARYLHSTASHNLVYGTLLATAKPRNAIFSIRVHMQR